MTLKSKNLLVGAHVSIAGGVYNAIVNGEKIGATAIQMFSKNQTRWISKPLSDEDAAKFRNDWQDSSIQEIIIHDSYLINLGSPDPVLLQKSRDAFLDEVERAEKLGVRYLIFHPGSHLETGEDVGLKTIAESMNSVIDARPGYDVKLLLETTAGQGTNLGYTFEQLAQIMELVEDKRRQGVCLDTAHVFAAGYDIRTKETYEAMFAEFDSIIGLENLLAIHVNDSKKELGSRVDRHENIGEGLLGKEPFRFLMNDSRFTNVPKLLETPGTEEDFRRNLFLLRSLVEAN